MHPGPSSVYSTDRGIGRTRVTGRPLGRFTSAIGISPSTVGSVDLFVGLTLLDMVASELPLAWAIDSLCVFFACSLTGCMASASCELPAVARRGASTSRDPSAALRGARRPGVLVALRSSLT